MWYHAINYAMNQAPKKVLFLITKATWGGAQKYVYDLATHLPKEEFNVSVAYGVGGRLLTMLQEKNVPTHRIPSLGRDVAILSDIASVFQILNLLRRERPHVLHVNSSKAAALGALAGRLCGVHRIIFTAHGWPFKEDRNFLAQAVIYFISWLTALLSHATIVVSKRDEEIGKKMRLVGKKIHYVPLGIEPPSFLSREEAATALSITTNVPRIVSIGELTKNKGYQFAIDAIAELKKRKVDVEYFIFSDGELRDELEKQTRDNDAADRIHFLGFVNDASNYLKAFDIFLLSSIKEGTPYVLLEAAAAGLPIVATNAIDFSFAQSENAALVQPANPQKLAAALARNFTARQEQKIIPQKSLENMVNLTCRLYT